MSLRGRAYRGDSEVQLTFRNPFAFQSTKPRADQKKYTLWDITAKETELRKIGAELSYVGVSEEKYNKQLKNVWTMSVSEFAKTMSDRILGGRGIMSFDRKPSEIITETNWDKLGKYWDEDNLAFVFEDSQGLTKKEFNILRRLAVKCHKKNCVLVISCLSLLDDGIDDLTDLVDEIAFTGDKHNERCLAQLLRNLGVAEDVGIKHVELLRQLEPGSFLVVQVQAEQVYITNRKQNTIRFLSLRGDDNDDAKRMEDEYNVTKQELMAEASSDDPEKDRSWLVGAIADMIGVKNIKKRYVMEVHGVQGSPDTVSCDIMDYAKTVGEFATEPTRSVRRAHRRLLHNRLYPKCLVLNDQLSKLEAHVVRTANPVSREEKNPKWWL